METIHLQSCYKTTQKQAIIISIKQSAELR